jgi:hypothetical protein
MSSHFKINNFSILGVSSYILPFNNDCTICCSNLNTNSTYNKDKGIDSKIVIGSCGHSYHEECIESWLNTRNTHCPLCSKNWQTFKKI